MVELLQTLYVQTQGTLLRLESETVRISVEGDTVARVPLLRLSAIVVFGNVTVTPFLIHRCAEDGRSLSWFSRGGRFRARIQGPTTGNVLLRNAQHQAMQEPERTCHVARQVIAAKIQNSRQVLLRAAREADCSADQEQLGSAADRIATVLTRLQEIRDLNELRGAEGEAARAYLGAMTCMIRADREHLAIDKRTRRPPRDPMNSLLSFLYALLCGECEAGLEGVGLDPQMGFLHALRPGRPALALDLMEEFRPVLADRLALTLINRRQITTRDFEERGGVYLTEAGRKKVLEAYQRRKEVEVRHRLLRQQVPLGLMPHVQSRLLARYLRGDINVYPPYVHR